MRPACSEEEIRVKIHKYACMYLCMYAFMYVYLYTNT